MPRLSKLLGGPPIFIKRDDLTGLALGGNKTRKLEFLMAAALREGCDTVVTAGAAQSNHCRQTAAAAAQMGMECHLLLGGEAPRHVTGNLLLDHLLGCRVHWTGSNRKGEDIARISGELASSGRKPYVVPYGGSNEVGALGFIAASEELAQQTTELFSHVVFASSSGGTHAGLMLGKRILNKDYNLVGIGIDKGSADETPFRQQVVDLANRTARSVGMAGDFTAGDVTLVDSYLGDGYGVAGGLEREAIELTARAEGILLDPVYSGRAMGGLIDMVRRGDIGRNSRVLFWHTGGAPALFPYADVLTDSGACM